MMTLFLKPGIANGYLEVGVGLNWWCLFALLLYSSSSVSFMVRVISLLTTLQLWQMSKTEYGINRYSD
jgi:hypothetical protein